MDVAALAEPCPTFVSRLCEAIMALLGHAAQSALVKEGALVFTVRWVVVDDWAAEGGMVSA